ncbi:MAG: VOC family protein [Armatimonadetes bacterium]|nr:VOC family protein [Armatimonadota bacterium]
MSAIAKSVPYIHFSDNCAEAMEFYKSCLGGDLEVMKVGSSPMAGQMPGKEDYVMHSQLIGDGWSVMASDWCAPSEYKPGNNWTIMLELTDEAEQTAVYERLSAGGTQTMPLSDAFWGSRFGMLKDKFGIDWMLNCPKT